MNPKNPASLLKLWDVIGSTIVTTQGCYLRAIKLRGIDSEHIPADNLMTAAKTIYNDIATQVPEKTFIQVILDCHSDYTDVFEEFEKVQTPDDKILELQRRRRLEFLKQSNLRRHSVYLFVGSSEGLNPNEFRQVTKSLHKKRIHELDLLSEKVSSMLERAGIGCREMREDEICDLFWKFLNPDLGKRPPYLRRGEILSRKELRKLKNKYRVQTIREHLVQSNMEWKPRHLVVGDQYAKVLTLRDIPEKTVFTQAEDYYDFDFDLTLSFCLLIPDQKRYQASLDQQRKLAKADAGRGGNIEDYKRTAKMTEKEGLAELLAETGQRLVMVGTQAVIKDKNLAELRRKTREFQDRMRTKSFFFFEENLAHDREYFKTLPGMAIAHDRHLLVTSNNAVDMAPIFEEDHGDVDPILLVKTARNELYSFNPFEEVRDNWNATVFGASGSGKSVFMNMLIASAILANKTKGRLIAIDFAGETKSSYLMISKMFGGEFIPVLSSGYALNPFPPHEQAVCDGELDGQTLTFLSILTDILTANLGAEKEQQLFRNIVQKGIKDTYKNMEQTPIYSDLKKTLDGYRGKPGIDQDRLKVILELLKGFLDSPTAKIFNRRSKATPKSRFLIIDLFGLDSLESHIAQAVTFVATQWVKQMAFDPSDPGYKYVILDEVAQLIKRQEMVSLVDELYSTARKHKTSVWTVTQSYESYRKSALANAVKLNSTTNIFLSHAADENGRRQIADDFQFTRREKSLFDNLRTVKGMYSQALIRTEVRTEGGEKRPITTVLKMELSPLDYQICTSDAGDREIQNKFIRANPDKKIHEVLEYIAYKKKRADS